jgi:hypothetical protein
MSVAVTVPGALVGARLAIAAAAAAAPISTAAAVGVRDSDLQAARPYVYVLCAREAALTLGYALASWRGHERGGWLLAMGASDAFDATVYELLRQMGLLHREKGQRARNAAISGAGVYTLAGIVVD